MSKTLSEFIDEEFDREPLLGDDEEQDNSDDAPDAAPGDGSPAAKDKASEPREASDDLSPDDRPEPKAEVADPAIGEGVADQEDKDPDELDLAEFGSKKIRLPDGRLVPLSEVPNGVMMRDDYTRKRQSEAEEVRVEKERVQGQLKLVKDIHGDKDLRDFLRKHPEAMEDLLANPEDARALIGSPEKLVEFWEDYEILKENPRIAQRFAADPEAGKAELEVERETRILAAVSHDIDHAITVVAQEVGADEEATADVQAYLFRLGGLRTTNLEEVTPEDAATALRNLQRMLVVRTPDGSVGIDVSLIRERFSLKAKPDPKKKSEQHNRKVDDALAAKNRPPATGGGSGAASADDTEVYTSNSFESVLQDLYNE